MFWEFNIEVRISNHCMLMKFYMHDEGKVEQEVLKKKW